MKRLAMMIAAFALIMSLAACGCTDKNASNAGTHGNGTTQNGGSGTTQNSGSQNTNRPGTNNNANNGSNIIGENDMSGGVTNNGGIGNNIENAVDDMGDAVGDLFDGNHTQNNTANNNHANNTTNTANPTRFQQMISNARVHDTDGVLTDGENSRW